MWEKKKNTVLLMQCFFLPNPNLKTKSSPFTSYKSMIPLTLENTVAWYCLVKQFSILCVAVEKTQQFCEKKGREIILVPHTQISLVLFFDSQKTVACLQKKRHN